MSFAVLASIGLVLHPFGPVSELVSPQKHWRGFDAVDPLLFVVRAQAMGEKEYERCSAWIEALDRIPYGSEVGSILKEEAWTKAWNEWAPWHEKDDKAILECRSSPCQIKLDPTEVAQLRVVPSEKKRERLYDLVVSRVLRYVKSGKRSGYERPEEPMDPWAVFQSRGFKSGLGKPARGTLHVRRMDLDPSRMRPLRQVLDRRYARSETEATLWVRDAYSAHYFDSWGEWFNVSCDSSKKQVVVVQALALELDLLKKTDLISRMGRGMMKKGVEEKGSDYLETTFNQLQDLARRNQRRIPAKSRDEIPNK